MKRNKIRELIDAAASRFEAAGVDSPLVDARILAAELLGVRPIEVSLIDELPHDFEERYAAWVDRREAREPLQHIVGTAPFGPLDLAVGEGVFIPRPETEVLADWAVRSLNGIPDPTVVDLGTGSGALALYIAFQNPDARVIAVEKSAAAREFAARNAQTNNVDLEIIEGDMTDPALLTELNGQVDLVVTNPPYVPETGDLQKEVYVDPHEAVFSGVDGMDAIRGLVPVAARLLKPGGPLGIEHDDTTSATVCEVVRASSDFGEPSVLKDFTGRDRFVVASKLAQE